MKPLSIFEEGDRKAVVYSGYNDCFLVVFFENNECLIEKTYFRDFEAEQAAEDFVLGFNV